MNAADPIEFDPRRRQQQRLGIRSRATLAALIGVLVAYLAVAGILIHQATDLKRGTDAVDSAVVALVVFDELNAGRSPTPALNAEAPENTTVVVADRATVLFEFGPHVAQLLTENETAPIGDTTLIQLVGRDHVQFGIPCERGPTLSCVIRVAVPTDSVWDTTLDNLWTILWIAAALLATTGLLVPWLAGRALSVVAGLSAEVNRISDTDGQHTLSRPHPDDEIRELVDTLNDMLGRLHAARSVEQRFLADASHELRNPVAAISITTENARRHPQRRVLDTTWDRLQTEADRLRRVVDQLLALTIAERDSDLPLEPIDLDRAIRSHLPPESTIETTVECDGPTFVMATTAVLDRICSNLLSNAYRHAATTVRIEIRSTEVEHVHLAVSDDGPGVPPGRREEVFEAFTRLDAARAADAGGAGLGLAIARSAARSCNGDLWIDPDNSSTFTCSLPLAL